MQNFRLAKVYIDKGGICQSFSFGAGEHVFDARIAASLFGAGFYLRPDVSAIRISLPEDNLMLKTIQRCYKNIKNRMPGQDKYPPFVIQISSTGSSCFLHIAGAMAMRILSDATPAPSRRDVGAWISAYASCSFWLDRKDMLKTLTAIRKDASDALTFDAKSSSLKIYGDLNGTGTFSKEIGGSNYTYRSGPVKCTLPYLWFLSRFVRASRAKTINVDLFDDAVQVWIGSYSRTVLILKCTSL